MKPINRRHGRRPIGNRILERLEGRRMLACDVATFELDAVLTGLGVEQGRAEFESECEHGRAQAELEIKVVGAEPGSRHEVSIDDVAVGTLSINDLGRGKLELSYQMDGDATPLPTDLPTIAAGSTLHVGEILQGTFFSQEHDDSYDDDSAEAHTEDHSDRGSDDEDGGDDRLETHDDDRVDDLHGSDSMGQQDDSNERDDQDDSTSDVVERDLEDASAADTHDDIHDDTHSRDDEVSRDDHDDDDDEDEDEHESEYEDEYEEDDYEEDDNDTSEHGDDLSSDDVDAVLESSQYSDDIDDKDNVADDLFGGGSSSADATERLRLVGDTNHDARVDSSDLVALFQLGEYEDDLTDNSTWQTGDWNGDGDFDSADLVLLFQLGLYQG